jgi:aspartyl-tRNA synthetase
MKRSHTCGELTPAHAGQSVTLCGWVDTVRDHGGILFIDLRDRYGLTQIVCDPADNPAAAAAAQSTRPEYVLQVKGVVRARPANMVNSRLSTGGIEIVGSDVIVLNTSPTPPFPLEEEKAAKVNEELRMQYRYLDLRRPVLQQSIITRHRAAVSVREYLNGLGFLDIETPVLTRSTPEGR